MGCICTTPTRTPTRNPPRILVPSPTSSSLLPLLLLTLAFTASPATASFQLTICARPNFGETCTSYPRPGSGTCMSVPWNDAINSLRVREGGCEFFRDYGCVFKLFEEVNAEKAVLEGDFGDRVSSFRCYY